MPTDLVLSKALADIYAEVRADSAAFVKYKDDDMVLRAIQRLLELVVETGDEPAVSALIKLGVVPRPKSHAQAKLEALRERFRAEHAPATTPENVATITDADSGATPPSSPPSSSTLPSPSEIAAKVSSLRFSSISFPEVPIPTLTFGGLFASSKSKPTPSEPDTTERASSNDANTDPTTTPTPTIHELDRPTTPSSA